MRVVTLKSGAAIVEHNNMVWLFGAPAGVKEDLRSVGLEPQVLFTTQAKAAGLKELNPTLHFLTQPLKMNGFYARPIVRKHGTDYEITADDLLGVKLLYSERGDVSAKDVEGYDLAIIKNKHRCDVFTDKVITWPWPDSEWTLASKVWSSLEDVPDNLKSIDGARLTLDQANFIARVAEASGEGSENWAIGISQFKKSYVKKGDVWSKKEKQKLPPEILELVPKELVNEDIEEHVHSEGSWTGVFKNEEGKWAWAFISSVTELDRQNEVFTPKAMKWAIKAAEVIGKGPLRYRHIPGLDGGVCTHQAAVGGLMFEKGIFDDTPVGLAMRRKLQSNPNIQVSLGLAYMPKDLLGGIFYRRALIIERSLTEKPAVPSTAATLLGETQMTVKALTADQLSEIAEELELDVELVKNLHQKALDAGSNFSGKEFEETLKEYAEKAKAEDKAADDTEEEGGEEEEEDMTEEEAKKEFFNYLTELSGKDRLEIRKMLDQIDGREKSTNEEMAKALQANAEAIEAIANAVKELEAARKQPTHSELASVFAGTPRAAFLTGSKEQPKEELTSDGAIQEQLKAIQSQLEGMNPKAAYENLYAAATSKNLNSGRGK